MREEEIREIQESFLDFSSQLSDHRLDRNKLHGVEEILFLMLCALICGCEGWRDTERYGHFKLEFLRTFFPYTHGIPSDDTLRRFFRHLDPISFQTAFTTFVQRWNLETNQHIAIDGKVSRHSFDGENNPLHLVSAFASDCRLVLAQEKVAQKSNEITAIPTLLNLLKLDQSVVTIDAMGCQKEIAQCIRDRNGDYVLSLKGNQGSLHQDVRLLFQDESLWKAFEVDHHQTVDGSEHGRLETRICRVVEMPPEWKTHHAWKDLQTLVEITSQREIKGVVTEEKRYYISSLPKDAKRLAQAVRSHWSIENSLHWILDVSFRDDDSRIRKGYAPQNIATVKHMALNLLQKTKTKRDSIKQLRKSAGWDNNTLLTILHNFI